MSQPTQPSETLDELAEELALNYDHRNCTNDCMGAAAYKKARAKVQAIIDTAVAEELEACLAQVPMPTLSYEQIENRIAALRTTGNGQAGQKEEA